VKRSEEDEDGEEDVAASEEDGVGVKWEVSTFRFSSRDELRWKERRGEEEEGQGKGKGALNEEEMSEAVERV
jgi:hypothetical protein